MHLLTTIILDELAGLLLLIQPYASAPGVPTRSRGSSSSASFAMPSALGGSACSASACPEPRAWT